LSAAPSWSCWITSSHATFRFAAEEALERVRSTALVAEADYELAPRPGPECAVCAYATLGPDAVADKKRVR